MNNTITIGDRVSWQETALRRPYLRTKHGVVLSINARESYAEIRPDGIYFAYRIPLDKLTKLGPVEAVADTTDWELVTKLAGDLSGAEPNEQAYF